MNKKTTRKAKKSHNGQGMFPDASTHVWSLPEEIRDVSYGFVLDVLCHTMLAVYLWTLEGCLDFHWRVAFLLCVGEVAVILTRILGQMWSRRGLIGQLLDVINTNRRTALDAGFQDPLNIEESVEASPHPLFVSTMLVTARMFLYGERRLLRAAIYLPAVLLLMSVQYVLRLRRIKRVTTLRDVLHPLKLFNVAEFAFYGLVVVHCAPMPWMVHRVLIFLVLRLLVLFFSRIARMVIKLAPPGVQGAQSLQNLLSSML